jgi:hypothetical protein
VPCEIAISDPRRQHAGFRPDGHHRIEAYKDRKWKAPIKCEWFAGSAQEAMDESLRRNEGHPKLLLECLSLWRLVGVVFLYPALKL